MIQSVTENASRGPAGHNVRDQIVDAAMQHFAHYGYEKTTVSDLARAIGFSKAYIYKFFESKQAIGEVICSNRLAMIMQRVEATIIDAQGASEQLRRLFRTLSATGTELFFHKRKLYDIAAVASRDRWPSASAHEERLLNLIQQILHRGVKRVSLNVKRQLMKRQKRSIGSLNLTPVRYCFNTVLMTLKKPLCSWQCWYCAVLRPENCPQSDY